MDVATRYCTATVIKDKCASTIIKGLFLSWIVLFGAPGKMLSDNGCEFNNSEMRTLGEAFNVKVMTTAAESPWSNGVCERQNAVIGDSVRKIMADCNCALEVALAWAIAARNSLTNSFGFSPNQLVFGYNPAIPNVVTNDLPALESASSSETVRDNLNALHAARQEFIKKESSERLARALRHNVRSTDVSDLQNGDEVFYKRNDSYEWHGPGIVIGRDGKQVLVRHGGIYVRAHACRLTRAPVQDTQTPPDHCSAAQQQPEGATSSRSYPPEEEDEETGNVSEEVSISDAQDTTDVEVPGASKVVNEPKPLKFVVGQRIKGIHAETGELVSGKILSRAGKVSGKYKHRYNVQKDSDGSVSAIDFKYGFKDLEVLSDEAEMIVLFNSEAVRVAKDSEINNWQSNDVYEEVDDIGQNFI